MRVVPIQMVRNRNVTQDGPEELRLAKRFPEAIATLPSKIHVLSPAPVFVLVPLSPQPSCWKCSRLVMPKTAPGRAPEICPRHHATRQVRFPALQGQQQDPIHTHKQKKDQLCIYAYVYTYTYTRTITEPTSVHRATAMEQGLATTAIIHTTSSSPENGSGAPKARSNEKPENCRKFSVSYPRKNRRC